VMPCVCRSRRRKAAVESGSGARELTEVLEERDVEVKAMLLHARDRRFKRRAGLSSVTMSWQPASARKHHGARERGQRRGATAAGRGRVTRGERAGPRWTPARIGQRPGDESCADGRRETEEQSR
jgi:hypothetical protein